MNYIYDIPAEFDDMLSEVVPPALNDKVVAGWKPEEYGDLVDFGGGVFDVTCNMVLELCDGDYKTLRKKIPSLTVAEAKAIISFCAK